MNLAEMQRQFYRLAAREAGGGDPAAFVGGTAELPASERVEIYANMFIWRQIDALREDFPKTAALLGDGPFYAMAEAYLREHPSTHASLSELGRHLPDFLRKSDALAAALAEVERARDEVFEAPDIVPMERLIGAEVRLRFAPALRLVRVQFALGPLWKALEEGTRPAPPEPRPESIAIWKKDFEVRHAAVDPDEARAIELAARGEPLAVVCEAFDGVDAAFKAISSWFAEGWIAAQEGT